VSAATDSSMPASGEIKFGIEAFAAAKQAEVGDDSVRIIDDAIKRQNRGQSNSIKEMKW